MRFGSGGYYFYGAMMVIDAAVSATSRTPNICAIFTFICLFLESNYIEIYYATTAIYGDLVKQFVK